MDAALGFLEEKFKADPQEMMNTMSWHETGPSQRLNPKAVQILGYDDKGDIKEGEEVTVRYTFYDIWKITY